ncbi:uncharacterized protein LOC132272458 [Cornus florida]|uniref:uncharacterized protein LOC132272458 n=1 Tax=Cornus florida TaxID=4283 RepID=UPI0028A289DE|nr:uncharacterized protein LOC132272458 [Cornus florida]
MGNRSQRLDLPKSKKKKWILVATELYTKCVEAEALSKDTGQVVANFIKENIICQFGVPRIILSDNGTPFVNSRVRRLLGTYQITHHKSTPYYPKGNGQAEATNKTLIRILSMTVKQNRDKWSEQLPLTLWAYRTTTRAPTTATPFSLVYGTEAVLPVEIVIPSASLAARSEVSFDPRIGELEGLGEKREQARIKLRVYQKRLARDYNAMVKARVFQEGDLVPKATPHVMKNLAVSKFTPKWEGPFEIRATNDSGYYEIGRMGSRKTMGMLNAKWLKKYYA